MSLRARVLSGIAVVALVLGVALVLITHDTQQNLVRQLDEQLTGAMAPVRALTIQPDRPPPPGPEGALSSLFVGYFDNGSLQTVFAPNVGGSVDTAPDLTAEQATAAAINGAPFTVDSLDGDGRYRVVSFNDLRSGAVGVMGLPMTSVDAAMRGLITVELIAAAVIFAVLALVAWWVIHLGVRPVKVMTSTATSIARGDLSARIPHADIRTEAGELGAALNEMLARIEQAFDERTRAEARLRQFVADASHELRTPVATIRGYAELYRTGGLERVESLDDAMRRTEQEAIRMGSLVDDLLNLAHLDQGRPLEIATVDLAQLVRDAALDARATDPSRTVETAVRGPVNVQGDEQRLRQVIANVVGNALVHTPPGSPIELSTFFEGPYAVVEVTDHGPGMTPETAARAFERFYRADPARSRHRGGSGLGLPIVEATVKAHGGASALRTGLGAGTTVRIALPAIDAVRVDSPPQALA